MPLAHRKRLDFFINQLHYRTIMTVRDILIAPDPNLKKRAEPVGHVDDEVLALMDDLMETMIAGDGIGLAAPQVDVLKRVLVISLPNRVDETPGEKLMIADPEIIETGNDCSIYEEGCLSLPEQFAEVERPSCIRFRYRNENDEVVEREVDGILATCVQHEIDHLNGVLFVDHISAIKRSVILRRLAKAKRKGELQDARILK
ncbi:MAG: peptide deformylase, partial [Pseudomonadota bacterium]|nr:peptide deformylase [Pseudomonadota bacterium]